MLTADEMLLYEFRVWSDDLIEPALTAYKEAEEIQAKMQEFSNDILGAMIPSGFSY
jgi:hypothetical protein